MSGEVMFERFLPAAQPRAVIPASCPRCGDNPIPPLDEAHQRILDLESQVKALNEKAAAAVDKIADYEDEVRSLRAHCATIQQSSQPQTPQSEPSEPLTLASSRFSPPRTSSRLVSLSSFLPGRRKDLPNGAIGPSSLGRTLSTPALVSSVNQEDASSMSAMSDSHRLQPPLSLRSPDLQSLETSLEKERTLRIRAESSLTQTQTELEDLTATLFGQANEMVATERKARAKLEERVKMLETRDVDKRKRLDRLEGALRRIERVRGLVERPTTNGVTNHSGTTSESEQQDQGMT